jgi:hypothetical protein
LVVVELIRERYNFPKSTLVLFIVVWLIPVVAKMWISHYMKKLAVFHQVLVKGQECTNDLQCVPLVMSQLDHLYFYHCLNNSTVKGRGWWEQIGK